MSAPRARATRRVPATNGTYRTYGTYVLSRIR